MARGKVVKTKIEEPSEEQLRENAQKGMNDFLASCQKRYKNNYSVVLASDLISEGDIEPLSTGHISFDLMTGIGGLPKGKIIEYTGEEGSHKSNKAWSDVGHVHAQNDYNWCLWIDAEKAIDLRSPMQRRHVSNMGVDFNRLTIVVPDSAEDCWSTIIDACHNGVTLIVLDSVTALIPKKELKAGVEADGYPALPASINRGFRSISKELWLTDSTLIEINQVRENLGETRNKKYIPFDEQWHTTGGKGLKHWLSLRCFFRKKAIKVVPDGGSADSAKIHIGDEVTVSVIKTRLAPKMDKAKLFMYHKSGFDKIEELMNMLLEWEILYKETPRAQKLTLAIDDEDEEEEKYTWDEWYELLESDEEYYAYLCELLSNAYNDYYLSDDSLEGEYEEQESEYGDEDDEECEEDEEE